MVKPFSLNMSLKRSKAVNDLNVPSETIRCSNEYQNYMSIDL